jgi:hypothetical protein
MMSSRDVSLLDAFFDERDRRIDLIFRANPKLSDHRARFPWLTNSLGDPFSGIWFIAENPSLGQVERVRNPDGDDPTIEAQWFASGGDRLFRDALVTVGFKASSWNEIGGWNCYVTNLIKEADYAERWKKKGMDNRIGAATMWAPVLDWEIQTAKPKLLVLMGGVVRDLVSELKRSNRIRLPSIAAIDHYSYVAHRPKGHLGPMHPSRVADYHRDMAKIRAQFEGLCAKDH